MGSVLLKYRVRSPTSNALGDTLQVTAFNEGSLPNLLGLPIPAPGVIIPNITDTDGRATDGWVSVPFVNVLASGGIGNSPNPTTVDHYAEIHFASPVGNPAGIGSSGQFSGNVGAVFWAVFRTTGANVYFSFNRGAGPGTASQYALWSQNAGTSWQTPFVPDTLGNDAMFMTYRVSAALDSTGATGEGDGNGLYVFDPASGVHYPFLPVPGTSRQSQSRVTFPTSFVARLNSYGDVGVGFVCSAGRGSVTGDQFVRVDYKAQIDYLGGI